MWQKRLPSLQRLATIKRNSPNKRLIPVIMTMPPEINFKNRWVVILAHDKGTLCESFRSKEDASNFASTLCEALLIV